MLTGTFDRVTDEEDCAVGVQCFHCGLDISEADAFPTLSVFGKPQSFCCHGCHAVCKAIIDAGLDDYYRHRTDSAISANRKRVPDFLKNAELFDRSDIQKDFVSQIGNYSEAALLLENIRCPACLWLNEQHLRQVDGVIDVSIDDVTQRARVRWDPSVIRLSDILRAITDIGYIAHPYDARRSAHIHQLRRQRSTERLIFAGAIGMLVMNFSLASYLMIDSATLSELPMWAVTGRWTSLLLSFMLLAYPGQEFFIGAWNDLKHRRLGMDIPVVFGLIAAFTASSYSTVTGTGEVYYDAIAMFIFFLLLARRWELRGKLSAALKLDQLARIAPRTASVLSENNQLVKTAVEDLKPGDQIRLLPGETSPIDGMLITGVSSFDESLLTGEVLPVKRTPGDAIIAGSVNGDQPVTVKVTHSVQQSAISEIQQLVERGLEARPPYAILADKVARGFVLLLLLVAGATAAYWIQNDIDKWLPNTIAVLIVTCPCALALATPVALAVAAGRLLDLGVVPLRLRALDALSLSDQFIFDKTGTLTKGKPEIADIITVADLDEDSCLQIASRLVQESNHPIAKALSNQLKKSTQSDLHVTNIAGAGVEALIDGQKWKFGKLAYVEESVDCSDEIIDIVGRSRQRGHMVSVLADAKEIKAVISFRDPVRPGVREMISDLKSCNDMNLTILSGDSIESVSKLGTQLGIENVLGDMKPADKLDWAKVQQKNGKRLVMFGDGINDAPTLAAADVSVSFADATDLANASSDFLILGKNAHVLVEARKLARKTRINIMQNFAWAGTYNLIAIPLAAAGHVPPWMAAIGMSLSSLLVVMNALRLRGHTATEHSNLNDLAADY